MHETIAERLKRIIDERHGQITMKGLSLAAGQAETYVRDIIKGRSRNPKLSGLAAVARVLKIDLSDLVRPEDMATIDNDLVGGRPLESSPQVGELREQAQPFTPTGSPHPREVRGYIPVLGSAQGGRGEDGSFELNGTVVDQIKAPPAMANVKGAYALYVQGTSMEPRYFEGELVYVNPVQPARVMDFVVIQYKPRLDGDPARALIKRLVGRTQSVLRVEQYNPAKIYDINIDEIRDVHRILSGNELW